MTYTVRIEGKPEPVEIEANNFRQAARMAVVVYDNEVDGALSIGEGSFVTVLVGDGMLAAIPFSVSCMTEPVYRERVLAPGDPRALALMAAIADKTQAARRIPPTVLSAARRVARRRAAQECPYETPGGDYGRLG